LPFLELKCPSGIVYEHYAVATVEAVVSGNDRPTAAASHFEMSALSSYDSRKEYIYLEDWFVGICQRNGASVREISDNFNISAQMKYEHPTNEFERCSLRLILD
jgi:hypothetical protein